MDFSPPARRALEIMNETSKNLFLTGKAGTGKSTLLDFFRQNSTKKCAILAPTGVAALNVDGETIHAFFGLKPGFELDEVSKKTPRPRNPRLFQRLETIVIDEISMVRADILDAVDIFLQKVRENPEPFGGVQMVFIGDLYQLPPVVTRDERDSFGLRYRTPFFFGADVFSRGDFEMLFVELEKIYRQNDRDFIEILNAVRNNSIAPTHIKKLNRRVDSGFSDDENYIHLTTTNADARAINSAKLDAIDEPEHRFFATVDGKVEKNQFPTDEEVFLKVGSQVMFVVNDSDRRWVNGTIGRVCEIDDNFGEISVELSDGKIVSVDAHTWEISKYVLRDGRLEREIIGSFRQIPVKLAWAITIHKSQGKTFDRVIVDLGRGSFAHGQTYVALSRCRTLEGMILKKPVRPSDIRMDFAVQKFVTEWQCRLAECE